MGFFEQFNIEEISIQEEEHAADNFIKAACSYNFGESCYYNKETRKFLFKIKKDDPVLKDCIPLGIIVNQSDDKRIISVVNMHYLNADAEYPEHKVNINMGMWDLFERYVQAFKHKLPNYRKLKKMFVRPATIYEMELIRDNKAVFMEQLKSLSDDKDVDIKFITKFNSGKTVTTKNPTIRTSSHKTPLYRWGPSIDAKIIERFDSVFFLPIFDIPIA